MTKARDLADRSAADLTAVSAGTGISVSDGDGPIPTVTNTVATGFDAKGDLIVGTGADTFAKLTVASTAGYLLSVDSGETTGLKWAAPASGGGLTLLSTTSLSGSTVTISSISQSYTNLRFVALGVVGTSSANMCIRLNGDTGNNYARRTVTMSPSLGNQSTTISFFVLGAVDGAASNFEKNGAGAGTLYNYTTASGQQLGIINGFGGSTANPSAIFNNVVYNKSAAIDSITFYVDAGDFSSGTFLIYGEK
jgi:hypothetical protein